MRTWREVTARFAVAVAAVALALGLVSGLVHDRIADGARFAAAADGIRRDPAVAQRLGADITAALVRARPDLVAVRPLVQSAVTAIVASPAFDTVFVAAVRDLHGSLVGGSGGGVVLRLADLGAVLSSVLPVVASGAADTLPPDLGVTLAQVGAAQPPARLLHLVRLSGLGAWTLPLLALLALAGSVALSRDRRRGAARAGWAVAAGGALVAALAGAAEVAAALADADTLRGALLAAGWRQVRADVWTTALLTAVVGVVVAVTTTAGTGPARAVARVRAWAVRAVRPRTRPGRWVLATVLVVAGLSTALAPRVALVVAAVVAGLVAALGGLAEVAALAAPRAGAHIAGEVGAGEDVPTQAPAAGRRRHAVGVRVLAAVAALAVVAASVAWRAAPVDTAVPAASGVGCNGSVLLCDRRYDQVAFPAAHNAMSAADAPGWFLPEQPTGVVGSLEAGVRVLLIDSTYGQTTQSSATVATAERALAPAITLAERDFGAATVASALRLRDTIVSAPVGPVQPYLCHGICELGATAWTPVMRDVRAWLDAHPREVVTFFVEDYTDPADTARVFTDAGLLPYLHVQRAGQPWPTLGQMIDSGQRVVVLAENHDGGAQIPWLLQGFDWVQDTPYTNPTASDLSCALNRGAPDRPLLLLNVWLAGFSSLVSDARQVNAEGFLGPYAERCAKERHHIPDFVAVNYWDQGDLFRVVARLNGLP